MRKNKLRFVFYNLVEAYKKKVRIVKLEINNFNDFIEK